MLKKSRTRRLLVLSLLGITLLLSIATGWLYLTVRAGYGESAALIALTVLTVVILGLICKGVQYAIAIERTLLDQAAAPVESTPGLPVPGSLKSDLFGKVLYQQTAGDRRPLETAPVKNIDATSGSTAPAMARPRKHRGKPSRFPISKITRAVLTWERRDPQFSSLTLTEFLEEEFGAGPDGILLMAPTTFYDWRRRVLRDLETGISDRPADLETNVG